MPLGINTTVNIDDAVRPMLAASRKTMEHEPTMKGLVRQERIPRGEGGVFRYPKYDALADAQDLSEGQDITQSHQIIDALSTITPTEIGMRVVITDRTIRTVRDSQPELAGELIGNSMARKLDKDGLTMLDGFSTALGSAGTALTWEHIAAARSAILGGSEPAPKSAPIYGVFHPHQLHILAKDYAPAGTYPIPTGPSADIQKSGDAPKVVGGVQIHDDGLLSKDSSDDAKGGVFSKEALILVLDDMPGLTKDHDNSLRAWEIIQTWWYGWGEYNDSWGREMLFDAITPTS